MEGDEYEREYLVSINEAVVVVESDIRKMWLSSLALTNEVIVQRSAYYSY